MHVSCVHLRVYCQSCRVVCTVTYAFAYNLVMLIRVQTKTLFLLPQIDQTSYRKEMDAIEPYSS